MWYSSKVKLHSLALLFQVDGYTNSCKECSNLCSMLELNPLLQNKHILSFEAFVCERSKALTQVVTIKNLKRLTT